MLGINICLSVENHMLVFLCVCLLENFCVRVFRCSVYGPALFRCVGISCELLLRTYIFQVCVYMLSSIEIYIYVCVCACVRVERKRLTRLENMHIYTSPIFIVAVYRWYQVCI